ncbi:MAG: pyridoxal 5'-phosphate synthase glutaminase subunit PdxT [Methanomicrobiales archaeon]
MGIRIGVLALQGAVSEHIDAFRLALETMSLSEHSSVVPVRCADEIPCLNGLAIPGGESTTISRLIDKNQMRRPIEEFDGGIFATCAGMVLMATDVDDSRIQPLGLIEMRVERNAFGRQKESFETVLEIHGFDLPYHAIFIRAPVVTGCGAGVEVLSRIDNGIVAVRKDRHYALAFHPELSTDSRLHIQFIQGLDV